MKKVIFFLFTLVILLAIVVQLPAAANAATVLTPTFTFPTQDASMPYNGPALFNFSYSGTSIGFWIDASTRPAMDWDVYFNFASSYSSPIKETNPKKWDKYSCGRTLYWRVRSSSGVTSPIRNTTIACPTPTPLPTFTFPTQSASMPGNGSAVFNFTYSGSSTEYTVDSSTRPAMDWDVYLSFAYGKSSPVIESNPRKWDKYSCGRTLYWKIKSSTGITSAIRATTITCPTPTPTPTSVPAPTITNVIIGTCSSSSCRGWLTTVVVNGTNFSPAARVELRSNTQTYNGQYVGGNGSAKIITDFYNLPGCRWYDVRVYFLSPDTRNVILPHAFSIACG